ncbi:MAG: ParB/RepB/Spo0J family partition protein [Longimicrobiales bacterium]
MSKDRLGRGLGALLGDYAEPTTPAGLPEAGTGTIPVGSIVANPFQPRAEFKAEELAELAASIKTGGLLQPIVVRPGAKGVGFELVAGERRLRAVRQLGWSEIPAIVREVDDRTLLVLALVENIQRQELGPMEEAKGYGVLREEFHLTQGEIAEAVGKSRSAVANMLRLLALPPSVRRLLEEGALTAGHARALLSLNDNVRAADLAKEAVARGWSVREMEVAVRGATGNGRPRPKQTPPNRDPAIAALETAVQEHLGVRAAIRWSGKGSGSIQIPFQGPRDLERVFEAITNQKAADVIG